MASKPRIRLSGSSFSLGKNYLRRFGGLFKTMFRSGKLNHDYRHEPWLTTAPFLKVLCLKWAWKVEMSYCDWIYEPPLHEGYYVKVLSIVNQWKIEWPLFWQMFPRLVSMRLSPSQFSEMMTSSPNELIHLKEVTFHFGAESVSDAISALSKFQSKCPSLEAIGYTSIRSSELQYVSDLTFPTIKHLEVNVKQECDTPINFTFLSATSKLFPGLKSVHITANFCCNSECTSRTIWTFEKSYEAFDALNYDFHIKATYVEHLFSSSRARLELYTFLTTKGDISGDSYSYTVKRVFPGKVLIHDVTVDSDGDNYDSETSDY
uniref:FBD domain-containing protein n=1 Tax=Panagrellus redivivus TaxID=6233 RepID=A0A7E4VIY8_PANRE